MNKHTRSVNLIDGHIEGMTDAEITKALECCIVHENCEGCPCAKDNSQYCLKATCKNALDLIKRQQAEIERYEQLIPNKYCVCTRVSNGLIYSESTEDYDKIIGEISGEAIKEFWKRFDKVLCENIGPSKRVYWKISSDGDNLVKEMTEVQE